MAGGRSGLQRLALQRGGYHAAMDEPRWLDEPELRLWRSFWLAQQDLERVISTDLATSGLSHAEYAVLVALSETHASGVRVGRLQEWLGWESSRLAHQLRRMEKRGLVRRSQAPDDRRGTLVSISEEGGRRILQAAPGHVAVVRQHFVDLIASQERDLLTDVMRRVSGSAAPPRSELRELA